MVMMKQVGVRMSQGVIYVVIGERFVDEALRSVASLKERSPGLPVTFFTNQAVTSPLVDQVIELETSGYHPTLKPRCMARSTYERTLFLDTDTYVCGDLRGMFAVLDRFDVAAAHANIAVPGSARAILPDVVAQVPEAFIQYNSGMILFRRSPHVSEFLESWAALIERNERIAHERGARHRRDQTALREALYLSPLQICTLPREYNCRYHYLGFLVDEVKILHGRRDNPEGVARQLNRSVRPRIFINYPLGLRLITSDRLKGDEQSALVRHIGHRLRIGGLSGLAAAIWQRAVRLARK